MDRAATGVPLAEGRFLPQQALDDAAGPAGEVRIKAREDVARAPDQTATPLRSRLLQTLSQE